MSSLGKPRRSGREIAKDGYEPKAPGRNEQVDRLVSADSDAQIQGIRDYLYPGLKAERSRHRHEEDERAFIGQARDV